MIFRIGCISFIWIFLFVSWEYDRNQIALAAGEIPQQAVRLRILAHSDAPYDQWLKNRVRDEIIAYVESGHLQADDIDSARAEIAARLPELERLVGDVLKSYGYDYAYTVELGKTDFPAKMYGRRIYPAGEYEALKITIGSGRGRNWWCVLFPPLCFVDVTSNKAESASLDESDDAKGEKPHSTSETAKLDAKGHSDEQHDDSEWEVRFWVWDWLKKWWVGA